MDENHQDKTESKLIATEDVRWGVNRKSKLWVPKYKKRTGFEGKTLWDWLQLLGVLAIPLILGIATLFFGIQQAHLADLQHQSDQRLAQQQHEADQRQALDQQRATILQTYIDNIQDLLLNHNLLKSKPGDNVATLARARTLEALQGLDGKRKGVLLNFLYEARLIGLVDSSNGKKEDPIFSLSNADLSNADLSGANLSGANLSGAILSSAFLTSAHLDGAFLNSAFLDQAHLDSAFLSGANLDGAVLGGADLSAAFLNGADLSSAFLQSALLNGAHLDGANLGFADLGGADLSAAGLSSAFLSGADLSGADLSGADLSNANLSETNLTQQQLDQVYSCTNAILRPGLTCHKNH